MKSIFILYILFLFQINTCSAQDFSFEKYLSNNSKLNFCEVKVNNGSYSEALKMLHELKFYPDFNRISICKITSCYFLMKNRDSSLYYAKKAVLLGLGKQFLSQYSYPECDSIQRSIYSSMIYFLPAWEKEFSTKINLDLKSSLDSLYFKDQGIRFQIMESIRSGDKNKKDSLDRILKIIDSTNQISFDELYNKYGWFNENKIGYSFKNLNIVIIHADKNFKFKYINALKNEAINGNCSWEDLTELQEFAFFKHPVNGNINELFLTILKGNTIDKKNNNYIFYTMSKFLCDNGTFNGRQKKIKIFAQTTNVKLKRKCLSNLKFIGKRLERYGCPKDRFILSSTIKIESNNSDDIRYFIEFI